MEMKIGEKLSQLRRKKGLTQEQLAEMLGVSAPAISKWETDHSYPDITLLCPLARALDTNVDTLLQFEETLSGKDVTDRLNAVIETARQDGYETGEQMLLELLRKYPNSMALKFHAAVAWNAFPMFFPSVGEEVRKRWAANKKDLLTHIRASGTGAYWQTATLQLAGIAITEDNLDLAEQLLKELPEQIVDPTLTWSQFHLKKEEPTEALKTVQKRLFSLVRQVLFCLSVMLNPKITADPEQALKICQVYQAVDDLFGCGGMSDGLFLELYLRMNCIEEAASHLTRFIDVLTGEAILPKPFLFSPGLPIKEHQPASTKELRQMLLKALEEESHQALAQHPKSKAAIEKLKQSL